MSESDPRASENALSLDRIVPFFQPIFDLRNQQVWRYECLARYIQVNGTVCSPSESPQLFADNNQCGEVTRNILHKSGEYFRHINMAWNINLSEADLTDQDTVPWILEYLSDYPSAARVGFEISANLIINKPDLLSLITRLCNQNDNKLFIDQFHVNSSGILDALAIVPAGIKASIPEDEVDIANYLSKLHALANQANLPIILQQVESQESLNAIELASIHYAQGFALQHPTKQAN